MSDSSRIQKSQGGDFEHVQQAQTLLTQINGLECGSDRRAHRGIIMALGQTYNASTYHTKPKNSSHLPDLLDALPTELWLHCLEEAIDGNSINLLPLTMVSKRWRDTLIDSPSLWTYVYVRDDPDYADHLLIALYLSRKLPLSVTMELPFPFPTLGLSNQDRHPILSNAYRIRNLTVKRTPFSIRSVSNVDVTAMDSFYDCTSALLTLMETLPILEILTLNHGFDYYSLSMSRKFTNTPRLKGVRFWCITAEVLGSMSGSELTYLSSSSSLESLYDVLPQLPRLRRLILTQAGDHQEDSIRMPQIDPSSLPKLEILEFYQGSPLSLYPFLITLNHSLKELQTKLSWTEFGKLAPFLSNLPSLGYLHIILKAPSAPLKGFEIFLPPFPRLHKFDLEQQPYPPGASSPGVDRASLASLLDACKVSMTKVHTFLLSLQDEVPIGNLLAMITTVESIRKFEFKGQIIKEENTRAVAPHIEELTLANETLLSYLYCPNALEIYIALGSETAAPVPPLDAPMVRSLTLNAALAQMIEGRQYPGLKSLTWIDPAGGCASIAKSFHTLTKISFDYASPRKECNDFCELLLRYPYSCRSLDTIEMRAFPEWDILLHMLRRRNFLPGQDVACISTIRIPGYPGLSILLPMTELLAGRFPRTMPSIAELSLSAVDGPYFDVNVPGCEDCIDCRMTCDAPFDRHSLEKFEIEKITDADLSTPSAKANDSREVKPLEGSDPPLPAELLEWFDGWSTRRRVWYAKWNKWDIHTRRKGACERHDYSDLVSITPSLLDGVPRFSYVLPWLLTGEDTIPKSKANLEIKDTAILRRKNSTVATVRGDKKV